MGMESQGSSINGAVFCEDISDSQGSEAHADRFPGDLEWDLLDLLPSDSTAGWQPAVSTVQETIPIEVDGLCDGVVFEVRPVGVLVELSGNEKIGLLHTWMRFDGWVDYFQHKVEPGDYENRHCLWEQGPFARTDRSFDRRRRVISNISKPSVWTRSKSVAQKLHQTYRIKRGKQCMVIEHDNTTGDIMLTSSTKIMVKCFVCDFLNSEK